MEKEIKNWITKIGPGREVEVDGPVKVIVRQVKGDRVDLLFQMPKDTKIKLKPKERDNTKIHRSETNKVDS